MITSKKIYKLVLVLALVLSLSLGSIFATSSYIYESSTVQDITGGVTQKSIERFTRNGWLTINVLEVDLSNPNIKIDTLSNQVALHELSTLRNLVQSHNAVAGINGGFFNWMEQSGEGYPDGPFIQSGEVKSASASFNKHSNSMATFSMDNLNSAFYDYWKTTMEITSPTGATLPIQQYNKPSLNHYNDLTILDRNWGSLSIGASEKYPDLVEILVIDDKVFQIRESMPSLIIPHNGYVIVTRPPYEKYFEYFFPVGSHIDINTSFSPNLDNIEMAVSGSAILLQDGKIPQPFSYSLPGNHPRTAIGTSKDGNTLLMVTVDGRQHHSIGINETDLAKLMLELGAHNALNLDGGGSTTMVSRKPATNSISLVNKPSGGFERRIATGIGVFTNTEPSDLSGLIIETSDTNIFVNTSRRLTVRGHDENLNPVTINQNEINWQTEGITGIFKNNVFYPLTTGKGTIKASIGNITTELKVNILSEPALLQLNETNLQVNPGERKTFIARGYDINGYRALLNDQDDITWTVYGNIGSFNKNVFTATNEGIGYISASIGDTYAYSSVIVLGENGAIADILEDSELTISDFLEFIPKDTVPFDKYNRSIDLTGQENAFKFSVLGKFNSPKNLLERILQNKLKQELESTYEVVTFLNKSSEKPFDVNVPNILSTKNGYSTFKVYNNTFMYLDIKNNGIRSTDFKQWEYIFETLENMDNNIFIFLESPLDTFNDNMEKNLLENVLTSYVEQSNKKVWIFYMGDDNLSYMKNGLKFVRISNPDFSNLTPSTSNNATYLSITVTKDDLAYEFKPIIK